MNVTIRYCTICFGYRARAVAVAEDLRRRFDANIEVIGGKINAVTPPWKELQVGTDRYRMVPQTNGFATVVR